MSYVHACTCILISAGPKPDTVVDFWNMVWQLKANMIVMLTRETEHGVVGGYL